MDINMTREQFPLISLSQPQNNDNSRPFRHTFPLHHIVCQKGDYNVMAALILVLLINFASVRKAYRQSIDIEVSYVTFTCYNIFIAVSLQYNYCLLYIHLPHTFDGYFTNPHFLCCRKTPRASPTSVSATLSKMHLVGAKSKLLSKVSWKYCSTLHCFVSSCARDWSLDK